MATKKQEVTPDQAKAKKEAAAESKAEAKGAEEEAERETKAHAAQRKAPEDRTEEEAELALSPKQSAPNPFEPRAGESALQAPANRQEEEAKTEITLTDGSSVTVDVPFDQVEQKLRDKNLVSFRARGSDESVQVNPASVASVKPA